MPALPAVRPARPPAVIKPVFIALPEPTSRRPDLTPLGTWSDLLTVLRSRCGRLFLFKSRIGSLRSPRGTRRPRNRLDQLALRLSRSALDADAGREVHQRRLVVRLQIAVRGTPLEPARGVLRGRLWLLTQLLGSGDPGLGVARLLLRFVGELLRLAVRLLGGGARGFGGFLRQPPGIRQFRHGGPDELLRPRPGLLRL